MSDIGDRGRRRSKKRGIKIKPFFQEASPPSSIGRPIILTKSSSDRQTPPTTSEKLSKSTEIIPTIILKSRDDACSSSVLPQLAPSASSSTAASSSSLQLIATTGSASSSTPQSPIYQIQQKSVPVCIATSEGSVLEARVVSPLEMKSSVKLVDENLQWCDNALEFLQDQSDYYVVGVLGLQSTGKSTLMSYLAGNKVLESTNLKTHIFKVQSRELRELGEHCTSGIDIFMTPERVILLDVQPILSASVMDHMMQYDKKYSPEYSSVESVLEIQSLQIASFLMAVCHTVLFVQGWMCDPSILRFIQAAEMLKPSTPATIHDPKLGIEDHVEHFPHLVFVHTGCQREDFTFSNVSATSEMYSSLFQSSKLKYKGTVGIGQSCVMPGLYLPNNSDSTNLFLIPDKHERTSSFPTYQGHPGYETLVQAFCTQVLSLPRHVLMHTGQSEKNWFHYAARTWELVKKSNLFMEYSRLLP